MKFYDPNHLPSHSGEAVSNKKIYLSLTMGLQISLGKLYGINKGQRVAIKLLTSVTF